MSSIIHLRHNTTDRQQANNQEPTDKQQAYNGQTEDRQQTDTRQRTDELSEVKTQ